MLPMTWMQRALLVSLLAAAMLAPLLIPGLRPSDFALRALQRQLQQATDEEAAVRLRQIAAFGEEAISVLVAELASPYPPRADEAYRVLHEQLRQWQSLPPATGSRRIARLAHELAVHQPRMSAPAASAAARLAGEILVWPIDRHAIDATLLLADCRTVVGDQPSSLPEVAEAPAAAVSASEGDSGPRLPTLPPPPEDAIVGAIAAEDAGLPPVVSSNASSAAPSAAVPSSASPRFSLTDDSTEPVEAGDARSDFGPVVDLRSLTEVDVMRHLHHDNHRVAIAATDELLRRGFTELHLQLAMQLFHPHPRIRQQLANRLPTLPNIDARPWLMQLSHDPAAEVRRVVIALLATSSDPELHRRLQQLELEETDAALLQQVRSMLRDGETVRR